MGYTLLNSGATVLIYGPTVVEDALNCTILTSPSGSVVQRTIPKTSFDADHGEALLASLADAVENILGEGTAVAASGTQVVDASGLLYDAVVFTVAYVRADGATAEITATVEIPVNVLTADTAFGSFLSGGSAAERINDTYQRLAAMANG